MAASWNTANEKHASRDSGVLVVVRLDSLLGRRQDILGWAGALTAPWSPSQETTGHELLHLATRSGCLKVP